MTKEANRTEPSRQIHSTCQGPGSVRQPGRPRAGAALGDGVLCGPVLVYGTCSRAHHTPGGNLCPFREEVWPLPALLLGDVRVPPQLGHGREVLMMSLPVPEPFDE